MSFLTDSFGEEEEDIFQTVKVAPRVVQVTEKEKNDPLRRAKIELGSHLSAEQVPISAKTIARRMEDIDGAVYNFKAHGFKSLDELLHACPDVAVCHRAVDGSYTYSAVTTESNRDIRDLVQKQRTEQEMRSFFNSGPSKRSTSFCSVFRNKRGDKITSPEEAFEKQKASFARGEEKLKIKSMSMTVERVRDIANFINNNRSDLEACSGKTKKLMKLLTVQEFFLSKTGLPLWGKILSEEELYAALNVPEYQPYLKITKSDQGCCVDTLPFEQPEMTNSERPDQSTSLAPSIQPQFETMTLLEDDFAPIEETGPGFRKEPRTKLKTSDFLEPRAERTVPSKAAPPKAASQKAAPQKAAPEDDVFASNNNMFGKQTGPAQHEEEFHNSRFSHNGSYDFGTGEEFAEPRRSRSLPRKTRREIAQQMVNESANREPNKEKNTLQALVTYVRQKGSAIYSSFSPDDQLIIDNSNIFSVVTESVSDTFVILNENFDESDSDKCHTRKLVESDIRWLAEVKPKETEQNLFDVQLCAFVPPRGVLFISHFADDFSSEMNEIIGKELRNRVPVKRNHIKVGKPYIYAYTSENQFFFLRVIILGEGEESNTLRVGFMDVTDFQLSDVSHRDLFELPEELNHKHYPTSLQWGAISALDGVKKEFQTDLSGILAGGTGAIAVFYPNKQDSIPYVDFIVSDGLRMTYLSSYLLGLTKSKVSKHQREKFAHYNVACEEMFELSKSVKVLDVSRMARHEVQSPPPSPTDTTQPSLPVQIEESVLSPTDTIRAIPPFMAVDASPTDTIRAIPLLMDVNVEAPQGAMPRDRSPSVSVAASTPEPERSPLHDLFTKFEEMVKEQDPHSISLYQTIRSMADDPKYPEVFNDMRNAMRNVIKGKFDTLF